MEYFVYHKEGLLGKHNSVRYQVADEQSVINLLAPLSPLLSTLVVLALVLLVIVPFPDAIVPPVSSTPQAISGHPYCRPSYAPEPVVPRQRLSAPPPS